MKKEKMGEIIVNVFDDEDCVLLEVCSRALKETHVEAINILKRIVTSAFNKAAELAEGVKNERE